MSIFHKTISDAVKDIDNFSNNLAKKKVTEGEEIINTLSPILKNLEEHHNSFKEEFREYVGMHAAIENYDSAIQKALLELEKAIGNTPEQTAANLKVVIEHLKEASKNIIGLERLTRKFLGNEHNFLR
jgi:molecular chaperone DnaK (HSP70)